MSTGHRIRLPRGFRIKGGRLQTSDAHLDVSTRLKRRATKRIRVGKRGKP